MKPLPPHTDAAHAAITSELVRLSLPHHTTTERPALVAPIAEPKSRRRKPGARR